MPVDYTLYYCTDRSLMTAETIEESVERGILGGCSVIQLREKECSSREFYEMAERVKNITTRYRVPLMINDRIDLALAVDADGVHVGQSDLPAAVVRNLVGKNKIVGVSAATVREAVQAEQDGADYLGVGAMFTTSTKTDTRAVSMETLRAIRAAVSIPIVVIGGINAENASLFRPLGVDGIAVVSAVASQPDERAAAKELRCLFEQSK